MEKTHKHEGVLTSSGDLRVHPVSRRHTVVSVIDAHNKATGCKKTKTETKALKKVKKEFKSINTTFKKGVVCPVDKDGFIHIDLTQGDLKQNGVRIKFQRQEGRTKKTVGLEIEK